MCQYFAGVRVDFQNTVVMPDIGPQKTLGVFQLIQLIDFLVTIFNGQGFGDTEILWFMEINSRGTIAADQRFSIGG